MRSVGVTGIEVGTTVYVTNLDQGVTNEDIRVLPRLLWFSALLLWFDVEFPKKTLYYPVVFRNSLVRLER